MEVQSISNGAFTVYLDSEDLKNRHITPNCVPNETVSLILREAFNKLGRTFEKKTYVEVYPGRNEIMLFVRLNFKDPLFFLFDDFESLAEAAICCRGTPFSSLFYIHGQYILAVYSPEGEQDPISFFEFGRQLEYPADYVLYLAEHGRELIVNNAVSVLRENFVSVF